MVTPTPALQTCEICHAIRDGVDMCRNLTCVGSKYDTHTQRYVYVFIRVVVCSHYTYNSASENSCEEKWWNFHLYHKDLVQYYNYGLDAKLVEVACSVQPEVPTDVLRIVLDKLYKLLG